MTPLSRQGFIPTLKTRPAVGVGSWLLSASKVSQWWSEGGGGNAAEALHLARCSCEIGLLLCIKRKKTLSKMPTVEVKILIKTLTLQKCDLPRLRRLDSWEVCSSRLVLLHLLTLFFALLFLFSSQTYSLYLLVNWINLHIDFLPPSSRHSH